MEDDDNCDHINTGRVPKLDGGRCPLLCAKCRLIVGTWTRTPDGDIFEDFKEAK